MCVFIEEESKLSVSGLILSLKRESNGFMTAFDPVPNNLSDLHDWAENDHFVIEELYLFQYYLLLFFQTYTIYFNLDNGMYSVFTEF